MRVCETSDVSWASDTCYRRCKCSKFFYFTRTCTGGFFHTQQHPTRKQGRASDEEQFFGRRLALTQKPTTAQAGGRLGWQNRKGRSGPFWAPARTTSPRGPRGAAHARWRGGSAAAGRREASLRVVAAAAAAVAARGEGDGSEAEWRCGGDLGALLRVNPVVSARLRLTSVECAARCLAAGLVWPRAAACA